MSASVALSRGKGSIGTRCQGYIGDTFGYHAKDLDVICFGKYILIPLRPNLGVLQIGTRAKVIENQVMDAPTIPVFVDSSEGNFRDTPAAVDAFPAVTIVVILASLGEAIRGIHEYLQGIRTMEAIETVTRSQERRTRREVEQ
ncbi:hypothetical protein Tco_1405197 [Tanacetum coccineum]